MTGIIGLFRNRREQKRRVDALYRGLMAAALAPEVYTGGLVADDLDHRVQMVSLHSAILSWRLTRSREAALRRLPGPIHARVLDGFDASFRETGVGDASIARKVRKLGEHYYGLGRAVTEILSRPADDRDTALANLLRRNGAVRAGGETDLALHLLSLAALFEETACEVFLAGEAPWLPYPATSRRGVAKGDGAP